MTITKLISFTALIYLAGCASNGGGGSAYTFPSSVTADRLSFGVSGGPVPQSFMLNMKFALSSTGEQEQPQAPPTDAQWQKAAEQALPPGCKIDEIKPTDGGEAQVKFSC